MILLLLQPELGDGVDVLSSQPSALRDGLERFLESSELFVSLHQLLWKTEPRSLVRLTDAELGEVPSIESEGSEFAKVEEEGLDGGVAFVEFPSEAFDDDG